MRRTLIPVLALLGAVHLGFTSPAAGQAIITNGTVTLGVNQQGHLNVPGPASPIVGTPRVGLRFNANSWEGLSHRSPCEGWGVGVATVGITAWANECFTGAADGGPVLGLTLRSFTSTSTTATSEVVIKNPFPPFQDLISVTHAWMPSGWPNLYQGNVRIRNANGGFIGNAGTPVGDIRYRRVMDWDIEPTRAEDFVSIGGLDAGHVPSFFLFSSDDGFEIADPLRFEFGAPVDVFADTQAAFGVQNPVPCGFSRNFTNCGRFLTPGNEPIVVDHGALFDFAFPALAPNAAHEFAVFYGAAATREEAERALYMVGAEVYSLANCRPLEASGGFAPCNLSTGGPTTFIFAAAGVGGSPAFGDISGTLYRDVNGNGLFDGGTDTPVAGVAVTVTGTDLSGQALSRTATSGADGFYVFEAMPRGTYTVAAPVATGALVRATASPLAAPVGGSFPYVMNVSFGYVAAATLRGSAYTDVNGNATFDAGTDTPLAGVTIVVNGPGGTRTAVTSADGSYSLGSLLPGTYMISAPASVGGQPLVTPSSVTYTLAVGHTGGVSFGYRKPTAEPVTSITGVVFSDMNKNHAYDKGVDAPLAGVKITLSGPGPTRTTTTGADGSYAFTGLAAGRYRVSAPRFVNGEPDVTRNPVDLVLAAGQQRVANFGYKKPPVATLHGVVFSDVKDNDDFNRRRDVRLAGVPVTLKRPDGSMKTAVTDAEGRYAFTDLLPGKYTLSVPASVNGQPLETRNDVTQTVHGGRHRVDFGYTAPAPDCKKAGHANGRDKSSCKDTRR